MNAEWAKRQLSGDYFLSMFTAKALALLSFSLDVVSGSDTQPRERRELELDLITTDENGSALRAEISAAANDLIVHAVWRCQDKAIPLIRESVLRLDTVAASMSS